MSSDNRLFLVQILVDSIHLYDSYKYDTAFDKIRLIISKFQSYEHIDLGSTDFKSSLDEGATEIKVDKGETFMFPLDIEQIESALNKTFIEFQVLLETSGQEKGKTNDQLLAVGYARIQLKDHLRGLISAVRNVKSDSPEVAELEGPFAVRQGDVQVATIFVGIRVTMFDGHLVATIKQGQSFIDSSPTVISPELFKSDRHTKNQQISSGNSGYIRNTGENKEHIEGDVWKNIHTKVVNPGPTSADEYKSLNSNTQLTEDNKIVNSESIYTKVVSELFGEHLAETDQDKINGSKAEALKGQTHKNGIGVDVDQNLHVKNDKMNKLTKEESEPVDRLAKDIQNLKNELNRLNVGPFRLRSKPLAVNVDEKVKHHNPKDKADLQREYTSLYSELNGQVIEMKIMNEPKVIEPLKMLQPNCV